LNQKRYEDEKPEAEPAAGQQGGKVLW